MGQMFVENEYKLTQKGCGSGTILRKRICIK